MNRIFVASIMTATLLGATSALAETPSTAQPPPAQQAKSPVPPAASTPAPNEDAVSITYVSRTYPPPLEDKTAGGTALAAGLGSLGGLAGAAAAGAANGGVGLAGGAKAEDQDVIHDPANAIGAKIAELAAPGLGAAAASEPLVLSDPKLQASMEQKYAQFAGGSRYVVNVQTLIFRTVWASYATWPLDLSHYIVEYMGKVTLRDIQSSKDVYRGRCFVFTKRTPSMPTHEELYADHGAILKTFIAEAADDCVAQLQEKDTQFQKLVSGPKTTN